MSMWLNDVEVRELTRRKTPAAQMRVLRDSGIKYKEVDERPVVLRTELADTPEPYEPTLRLVR